jgi:hypothetical protein
LSRAPQDQRGEAGVDNDRREILDHGGERSAAEGGVDADVVEGRRKDHGDHRRDRRRGGQRECHTRATSRAAKNSAASEDSKPLTMLAATNAPASPMSSHGVRCHSRLDTDSVLDSRAVVESWTNPARRGEVLFVCPYEDLGDAGGRDDALEVAPS